MANKQHLHKLLSDELPVLCRNGLPPSVKFRVEALIGITVVDEEGKDVVGEGNATVLSLQQTVSDNGAVTSKFGSNGGVASAADDGNTASHTPRKHPVAQQTATATITVKKEQEPPKKKVAKSLLSLQQTVSDDGAVTSKFGSNGGVASAADDGSTASHTPRKHPVAQQTATATITVKKEPELPKKKVAKPGAHTAGAQSGSARGRKAGGAARGGTRSRAGRAPQDQATAIAVR